MEKFAARSSTPHALHSQQIRMEPNLDEKLMPFVITKKSVCNRVLFGEEIIVYNTIYGRACANL